MQINKKWFIDKKTTVGFGFALSILVGIGVVEYLDFLNFRKSAYSVERTHSVLETNEDLLTLVTDAETGERGYLLTGEERYLEPYRTAVLRSAQKIKQLEKLTSDNPNQQRRLDAIEPLIAAKLAELKQTIDLRQNKGLEAALQLVKTHREQQLMEQIRKLSREIKNEENQLLQKRYEQQQASVQTTNFVIILGSVVAFGLVAVKVTRDISDRKLAQEELQQSEERFRATFNSAAVGIAHVDTDGKWLLVNQKLCDIVGYTQKELQSRTFQDITHPSDLDADIEYVRRILATEIQTYSMEKRYIRKDGSNVWINLTASLVRESWGEPKYFIAVVENISERKRAEEAIKTSLQEKEVLLKEVHHRFKNNLQVIDSLFRHQCRHTKDKQTIEILKECQNRVNSMALLHEKLYQSKDLSKIDLAAYIQSLVANLFDSYILNANNTTLQINVDDILLDIETALPCGLIVNELVSNSLKYAFPTGSQGEIHINFHSINAQNFLLSVKDNGVGLPSDFDFQKLQSLGLKLVRSLVRQIGGTIEINRRGGTEFLITFTGVKDDVRN